MIFGNRKIIFSFIFGFIFITIAFFLNFFNIEISKNLVNIMITIYIGYLSANVFSKTRKTKDDKKKKNILNLRGKRKFVFSLVFGFYILILSLILVLKKKPIQDGFFEIVFYVYVGYLFSNTLTKYTKIFANFSNILNKKGE